MDTPVDIHLWSCFGPGRDDSSLADSPASEHIWISAVREDSTVFSGFEEGASEGTFSHDSSDSPSRRYGPSWLETDTPAVAPDENRCKFWFWDGWGTDWPSWEQGVLSASSRGNVTSGQSGEVPTFDCSCSSLSSSLQSLSCNWAWSTFASAASVTGRTSTFDWILSSLAEEPPSAGVTSSVLCSFRGWYFFLLLTVLWTKTLTPSPFFLASLLQLPCFGSLFTSSAPVRLSIFWGRKASNSGRSGEYLSDICSSNPHIHSVVSSQVNSASPSLL